jgi:hypothetical protein
MTAFQEGHTTTEVQRAKAAPSQANSQLALDLSPVRWLLVGLIDSRDTDQGAFGVSEVTDDKAIR